MDNTGEKQEARRVIKRYSNRKLYDTRDSRYVTLLQIAEMVRRGEDVQIIDNTTKEDKTEVTLALAISEELKTKPRSVPLGTLRTLIQERGEKLLTSLRDGPIGRFIPTGDEEGAEGAVAPAGGAEAVAVEEGAASAAPADKDKEREKEKDKPQRPTLAELVATSRHTLDNWQHAIDERIRAVLPSFSLFRDIQSELRRLTRRVKALEDRVGSAESTASQGAPSGGAPGEPATGNAEAPTETRE